MVELLCTVGQILVLVAFIAWATRELILEHGRSNHD